MSRLPFELLLALVPAYIGYSLAAIAYLALGAGFGATGVGVAHAASRPQARTAQEYQQRIVCPFGGERRTKPRPRRFGARRATTRPQGPRVPRAPNTRKRAARCRSGQVPGQQMIEHRPTRDQPDEQQQG